MKKSIVVILAALCAAALFGRGPADANPSVPAGAWTSIGPFGGGVVGIARNPKAPSELYTASPSNPSQIFRSANNGASWARQSILARYVYDIAINPKSPGTIYALCDRALQVSKDKGKTFSSLAFPANFSTYNGRIAVHPSNSKVIFISGYYTYDVVNWDSEMAVIKTTNGGASWTLKRLSQQTEWGYGYDIAVAKSNPNYVYVCGFDNKNNASALRVFVSKNGGGSWTSIGGSSVFGDSTYCKALHVDPRDPKKAWVGFPGGIARTANAGASWKKQISTQFTNVTSIAADASNPNILYAGGKYDKKYSSLKSTDGGATWTAVSDGVYGEARKILASGANILMATGAGIFRSKNGGAAWAASHNGIRAANIEGLGVAPSSPGTIYVGIDGYAVLKTTNGGGSWTPCEEFYGSHLVASLIVHPTNPKTLYVKPSG